MLPPQQHNFDFEPDSFEQYLNSDNELQHSHAPSAIPANHQSYHLQDASSYSRPKTNEASYNYDLTFKKQKQFQFMSGRNKNIDINQKLFKEHAIQNPQLNIHKPQPHSSRDNYNNDNLSDDQSCIQIIQRSKTFKQIYYNLKNTAKQKQILKQQYLNYLLSQYQIDQVTRIKIETLLQMLILKNLRRKKNSAKLNVQVMKSTIQGNQIAQADKHRLEILELLVVQLYKKILIQCLKYNKMKKFCDKVLKQLEQEDQMEEQQSEQNMYNQQDMFSNQMISHNISKQKQTYNQYQNSQSNKIVSPIKDGISKQNPYFQQSRVTIFTQIVTSLINKAEYPIFKHIEMYGVQKYKMTVHKTSKRNSFDQIQAISKQNYNLNKMYQQDRDMQFYQDQPPETQSQHQQQQDIENEENNPIQQIQDYIRTLKKSVIQNPKNSHDNMKNYFIKWKIFFLNNIIMKMQADPQISKMQKNNQQNIQSYPFSQFASNHSIQTDLKQQKYNLKQFLRTKRSHEFFKCLGQIRASKGIIKLIKQDYTRNLMKKVFNSLYQNKQHQINIKQAQIHAQFIAENQDQRQQMTSKIFHRTNCIAKAFFGLKNYIKYSKLMRILSKTIIKLSFLNLKYQTHKQQQNQIKLQKYLEKKRRQYLFKCFIAFKSTTSFSNDLNNKIVNFQNRKNIQLLQFSYSAICLYWKKKLTLRRRLQNILLANDARRFFNNLNNQANLKYQQQARQMQAIYLVQSVQKRLFIDKLTQNYLISLKNKRTYAKQARLEIQRTKKYTIEALQEWRKLTICRKNYSVVQKKLKKLKQLQEKQKLFKLWKNRLFEKMRQSKKDKLTSNHKLWLNKYYQKLCAIEQQQLY